MRENLPILYSLDILYEIKDLNVKYGWSCSSFLIYSGSKNTLDMKTIRQDINFYFNIFQRLNVRHLKFYSSAPVPYRSWAGPTPNKTTLIENKEIFYQ